MVDDVETLSLIRECSELEERYGSDFTTQILKSADHLDGTCVLRRAEKCIKQKDQALHVTSRNIKIPTHSQNHHGNWLEKSFGIKPWTTAHPLSRARKHGESLSLSRPCKNEMPTV